MNENTSPEDLGQPDLWLVDRLVDGTSEPGEAFDADVERLAELVSALRRPASGAELAAEKWYVSAFEDAQADQRKPLRTIVIGSRAVVVAGIAIVAAATGAAAYTGSLPGPLQRAAHSVVGAPADDQGSSDAGEDAGDDPTGEPSDDPTGTPTGSPNEDPTASPTGSPGSSRAVGPDATGPAAFGLCTAWSKGGLSTTSVAYRNLETASGGAGGIAAYCATVVKPGNGSSHGSGTPSHPKGSPPSHPHGSPSTHGHQPKHAGGSPATHPGHH